MLNPRDNASHEYLVTAEDDKGWVTQRWLRAFDRSDAIEQLAEWMRQEGFTTTSIGAC